jgi:hypothetical protein
MAGHAVKTPGRILHMSNRKHKLSAAERKEIRRREAEKARIFKDEGFTEEDIKFMTKRGREALLKKYGYK